jgi:SSS family transporter
MIWLREHALQLSFLVGYLALLAYHGWRGKRASKSLADFLIGGRGMGGVIISLSFFATFVSSVTFVGLAGRSYGRGPAWWIICVVVFTTMVLLAWFVVAPPFVRQSRKNGALTVPEFLGIRYDSLLLRRLAGLVVVAASLAYLVAVYVGAARLLESLLNLDGAIVLIGLFLVVTTYTLAGGFYSVVSTDAVQGVILFAGALLLPVAMIARKGGLGPLLDSVREAEPTALDWTGEMPLVTMFGLALGVGIKIIVEPRQLSRFYGLASDEQLRRGRWIAPALLLVTYLCVLPVGFLAHAFVPSGELLIEGAVDTDLVVPQLLGGASDLLGPIGGAFFLTALVAAAMSSLDSVLLVAASSVDRDLIAPGRDEQQAMRLTRRWVVVLSAVATGIAFAPGQGIVEMSSFSGSMYAACFLPTLIIGLFWKRGSRAGALAALVLGFGVTLFWFLSKNTLAAGAYAGVHEVYVGMTVSIPLYVVISLLRPSVGSEIEAEVLNQVIEEKDRP